MEFIDWKDIDHNGRKRALCPKCSHTRTKNKKDKCLSVNHDKGTAYCHHCEAVSFRDSVEIETKKSFKIPVQTWRNYTNLSDNLVKYLESRNIKQSTAIALKWTEEKYYQPALNKEVNNLVFNFFEGETIVNKKYRSGNKKFTQSAGTKSIFYNINSVIGKEEVYIVEGEFDVAAMYEVGKKAVISVPNGANDNDEFWKQSEKYLKDVKHFIIAVDNDEKGEILREKISQRLGRYRCSYINFKGKDANDDLISGDLKESLRNVIRFPVNGTFKASDLYEGMLDLYDNGLPETIYPKHPCFGNLKDVYSVMRGQLSVGTGVPSHGKSNFTDWYVLNLIKDYDMKASWFSPEHSPMELYHTNLCEKVVGVNYWGKVAGEKVPRIKREEIEQYKNWADERIYLTSCTDNKLPTWDWVLETFKEQMYSYGIDIFVIDAFNKLLLPKGNKIDAINEVLTKLTHFAQANNVLIFLIAHPTKMKDDDNTGISKIPTLYDVAGSADFRNQTHNGYTIYRYWDNPEKGIEAGTDFINMKTKFNFQGEIGQSVKFNFCKENGRYYVGNNIPFESLIDEKPVYQKEVKDVLPNGTLEDAFGNVYNVNDEIEF